MKDLNLPLLQSLIKAPNTRLLPVRVDDTGLAHELATLVAHIHSLRDQLEKSETRVRQLESIVETDELTGLFNRRGFRLQFNCGLKNNRRALSDFCIVVADLDGLKRTNDQYGHAAGDAVLRHFAWLIKKHLPEQSFAARLGGDEFAIGIWSCDSKATKQFIANVKAALTDHPLIWQQTHILIQASFGAVQGPRQANLQDILHSADLEMYREKHSNRNPDSADPEAFLPQTS